jgi:nucleoside-triphosphatase THEP1
MDDPVACSKRGLGFRSDPKKRSEGDFLRPAHRVILVSGPKHSGKTTLVETVIATLAGRGGRIAGILARGLWQDGLRAGFDLVNLSTGHCTPLARRRTGRHPVHGMMFDFFDEGFRAGAEALSLEVCRGADIVVVDEIGRLEAMGEGWAPYLDKLRTLEGPVVILVARLDCMPRIRNRFDLHDAPMIDVRDPDAAARLHVAVGAEFAA